MDPSKPLGQSWIDSVTDDVDEITVESSDEVRRFVEARGGELYVWLSHHGWRACGLTLVEAATDAPGGDRHFRRLRSRALGFDLYLEAGRRLWPRQLVLDLARGGRKVRAYWNGTAWVL